MQIPHEDEAQVRGQQSRYSPVSRRRGSAPDDVWTGVCDVLPVVYENGRLPAVPYSTGTVDPFFCVRDILSMCSSIRPRRPFQNSTREVWKWSLVASDQQFRNAFETRGPAPQQKQPS